MYYERNGACGRDRRKTDQAAADAILLRIDRQTGNQCFYKIRLRQSGSEKIEYHPDIDGIRQAIEQKDLKGIASRMGNVLELVTCPAYPVIGDIKNLMIREGALNAMMSGSGPTVFGLFEDKDTAQKAYETLRDSGLTRQTFLTTVPEGGGKPKR